jgi:hypothetical protein
MIPMKLFLLDVGMPVASWLGIVATGLISLLGFLLRDAYIKSQKRNDSMQGQIDDIEDAVIKERNRSDDEMRKFDQRINDMERKILEKLGDIKDKFNELRK